MNCSTAPLLCQGVNGYCATLGDSTGERYFFGCAGNAVLNNEQWISFLAGSSSISLEITPSHCQSTGTSVGVQAGLFQGCPNLATVIAVQCDCTTDPFVLSSDSFVVGQRYTLVVDGCAGDICDYSIAVLSGSTIGQLPDAPGPITGADTVCAKTTQTYSIAAVEGATNYFWQVYPNNAGSINSQNGHTVAITWNEDFHGAAQLCVTAQNSCRSNPDTVCESIRVYSSPKAFLSGDGSICAGLGNTVDLHIQFTGGGPWAFTPALNGVPQTPLVANSSPYTLSVSEPGNWTLQNVYQTEGLCPGSAFGNVLIDLDTIKQILRPFCPGESVFIGGQAYTQPGIVRFVIPGSTNCDGIIDFNLVLLPQPTREETLYFCPGESVALNGQTYQQPGTVTWTVPGAPCDSLITYHLQYWPPEPSQLSLHCPADIMIQNVPVNTPAVVQYAQPDASSDCHCTNLSLHLNTGLPSGAPFPPGLTTVCYQAEDACGQTATCCFKVSIGENTPPCDIKQNGCMRYELLSIQADAEGNHTYRIRVQNNCDNPLIYTAIQVPDGVTALAPADLAVYDSPEGYAYQVRNPNYSPFYAIRYKTLGNGIAQGQSATLAYTLPAQSDPDYIHILSKLAPQQFVEAHLNTFYCPVGQARPRSEENAPGAALRLYPNPNNGRFWVDASAWPAAPRLWQVRNSQGAPAPYTLYPGHDALWELEMPLEQPNGLYFLEIEGDDGLRQWIGWVLLR